MCEWQPMETASRDLQLVVYGYPIERYSDVRQPITWTICEYSDRRQCWVDSNGGGEFEPLGWLPSPDWPHSEPVQQSAPGVPAFMVGDKTMCHTRYDGLQEVTITKVIDWPSGWHYALSEPFNLGHGNGCLGHEEIDYFHDGELYGRPISEHEVKWRPNNVE